MPDPTRGPIRVLKADKKKKIDSAVTRKVAARLGVGVRELPAEVRNLIEEQTEREIAENTAVMARSFAAQEIKNFIPQETVENRIKNRFDVAVKGLTALTGQQDVKKALDENAKLLKMKFDALVAAGFDDEQSFKIVVTELSRPRR